MSQPSYLQVFSITDHTQPFQGRYEGSYHGINAELQTSEIVNEKLMISKFSKIQTVTIPENFFNSSKLVLAYRHSDTGSLNGTSESIFSITNTPWNEMPGFSILNIGKKDLTLNLWSQEMKLKSDKTYRIRFGKTVVYLKNFGPVEGIEFTDQILSSGPASLHSETVDEDMTIAPGSGSAIQVKMGQEIKN